MLAYSKTTGYRFHHNALRRFMDAEPYMCWGFTVIPQRDEHLVLASWLKDSHAAKFFDHLGEANGRELEAAVSAELVVFCENWFLDPAVWDSYSQIRRQAIVGAYDNTQELLGGDYNWLLKRATTPWYDFMKVPNRQQINLFRYNEGVRQDLP